MHSPKKLIPSTGSKSNTSPFASGRNTIKRKINAAQFKKSFEEMLKTDTNMKDDFTNFDEEAKTKYSLAIGYINSAHRFMNKKLCENYGECGDANSETNGVFRMPDIPNYSTIFSMLLEKSKPPEIPVNRVQAKEETRCGNKSNISELVPDIKKLTELETLQSLEETTSKDTSRANRKGKVVSSKPSYCTKQKSDVKDLHLHVKNEDQNCVKTAEVYSTSTKEIMVEELVMKKTIKEEMEVIDIETKRHTDTNIPQYLPEEIEYTEDCGKNKSMEMVGIDQESIMDLIKQQVQEEFSSYLKTNEKQTNLVSSSHHVVNIQPQLNLLEYAQKKLARKNLETQTMHTVEDTQRRVNDMFKRISHENIAQYSREDDEYSDDVNIPNRVYDVDESDSDSVILDDEEFEKMHNGCREDSTQETAYSGMSHPLKLTGKDMPKLNEKMLNTIGLFTERGDIRPGILHMMEMQKQAKASDSRNKQFRVKRQWNLQVQKIPKTHTNLPSVSSEKSFLSISSDVRYNTDICKNA